MNKRIKLALIVAPIAAIAVGGAVYALPDKKQPAQLSTQPVSTVQTEATSTTDTQPVATETQTTTTSVNPAPTPTPAPQPDWGEDPNMPGVYKVFNKTALMDAAGIAVSDRETVNAVVRGWVYYRADTSIDLCGSGIKAKIIAEDWRTNPVTQLKYCDYYAKGRYGSWVQALAFYEKNKWW